MPSTSTNTSTHADSGKPGILWVASDTLDEGRLSGSDLCAWYEDVHIAQVTALSGVPGAARYEAVQLVPDDAPKPAWLLGARWLTLYDMPDLAFRHGDEFAGLDGQSEPAQDLLDKVFRNARFATRFWERIQTHESELGRRSRGPAPLIISATLTLPSPTSPSTTATGVSEDEFHAWYTHEHLPLIGRTPGYLRTHRYALRSASVLHGFERRGGIGSDLHDQPIPLDQNNAPRRPDDLPVFLAVHEFDDPSGRGTAESFPMADLAACDETEWSKRVIAGLAGMEAGFFRLKRGYGSQQVAAKTQTQGAKL